MYAAHHWRTKWQSRGYSLSDLLGLLFMLLLLLLLFSGVMWRGHAPSKRSTCATNLRGMGMGMHIYANDNEDWFPHHAYKEPHAPGPRGQGVAVRWVGTMGSTEFLKMTEQTSPAKGFDRNHPSRSLFMMIICGMISPGTAVCPDSREKEDGLRNMPGNIAAQPGVTRFDFAGYTHLSYGYQLPFGAKAKPRSGLDPRMAVAADKGPYYAAGGEGLPGSGSIRDQRSEIQPPEEWTARGPDEILKMDAAAWRPYNSRNHKGDGQNVLFVDSHVEFAKRPCTGVHNDNIYTLQSDYNLIGNLVGMVPDADHPLGPLTNTDSFIVP